MLLLLFSAIAAADFHVTSPGLARSMSGTKNVDANTTARLGRCAVCVCGNPIYIRAQIRGHSASNNGIGPTETHVAVAKS